MPNYHLVILKKPYFEAIVDGRKRIESRFSKTRRGPFGRVLAGDKLFLKVSSGPVCATATVAAVKTIENLTPKEINKLRERYNHYIRGSGKYWLNQTDCKFGFLAWLKDIRPIKPVQISKKDWRGWVILTEKENFGLLNSNIAKNPCEGVL